MFSFKFGLRFFGVVSAMVIGMTAACSSSTTDGTAPSEMRLQDESSMDISVSTDTLLAGTLKKDGHAITFEMTRKDKDYVATIRASDGSLLFRALVDKAGEELQLGEGLTLRGPQGSIFVTKEPHWEAVDAKGDMAIGAKVTSHPDFALVTELAQALPKRTDIDTSVFPPEGTFDLSAPVNAKASGQNASIQTHDPVGCGLCHGACVVMTAACVAATWGIFAWVCAFPGVACHVSCAATRCW